MSTILHIETSTTVCSVAIATNGKVLAAKEINDGYSHAENLSIFIENCLTESNLTYKDLEAVAISKGPGSYTGLRIGVATAKGLCYALDIPLIAINTLEGMAFEMIRKNQQKKGLYCAMIDARRMEVYCTIVDNNKNIVKPTSAIIINNDSFLPELEKHNVYFFGNGSEKCINDITHKNAQFIKEINPSAESLVSIALDSYKRKTFENLAYFEPYYLKDFIATTPKKLI